MKLSPSLIHFRPAVDTDIGFILDTWLLSYRDSPFGKELPDDVYDQVQREAIMRFISENSVMIACVPEDHDSLIGFICYNNTNEPTTVHYLYVKFVYRNAGVAQMLLKNIQATAPIVCTQVNKKFYELRSINFLPIITIREFDDMETKSEPFAQWFINHLQEFRDHRAEIMKERNQRAYRRKTNGATNANRRNDTQRLPTSMSSNGGSGIQTQATQKAIAESHRETSSRTQRITSQQGSTRGSKE